MTHPEWSTSRRLEEAEDLGSNQSHAPSLGDVVAARLSRRDLGRGLLAVVAAEAMVVPLSPNAQAVGQPARSFAFDELAASADHAHHVAPGYDADVLIRWGDAVLPDAPAFDPQKQSAAAQAQQFGYNNDFIGYLPIDGSSDHGLLVVNHEYTSEEMMFPGAGRRDKDAKFAAMTADIAAIEMMAHGGSVIEIKRTNGAWSVVSPSRYARRITAETGMPFQALRAAMRKCKPAPTRRGHASPACSTTAPGQRRRGARG